MDKATVVLWRQNELQCELLDLRNRMQSLQDEIQKVAELIQYREMQYDMLTSEEQETTVTTTTTTSVTVKTRRQIRNEFYDAMGEIVQVPMKMKDIISRLRDYGFQWNDDSTAHNYIKKHPRIVKVDHGIYQLKF